MIKGLMITPPVIGRISIGKVVEKNGKRLPEKDDEFTITTQVQIRGQWLLHPLDEVLRQAPTVGGIKEGTMPSSDEGGDAVAPAAPQRAGKRSLQEKMGVESPGTVSAPPPKRKLRSIPVRVLFNDPDLNLRANYCMFDRNTARPLCVGDGESCKRITAKGLESMACPGPDACSFSMGQCKPYGRLNVSIGESDELGSYVFRTTGFNSIRTLTARLQYFAAVSGGHLAAMPLEMRLRGKSTTQSHRAAIYYADLVVRTGLSLNEAIGQAKALAAQRQSAGFAQNALDEAARLGYANGSFEDTPEEAADIVEEFYPEDTEAPTHPDTEALQADNTPFQAVCTGLGSSPLVKQRHGPYSPYANRP
ncbi:MULTISPECIES: phage capsid protein [Comamonas]|jgi:hypothetical protein|uniref:recombination directionality factor n=1 Tax=Comamonas TaxID=283 RepID=UPI001FD34EA2|nr:MULTISPECIES: phage capsid protein [Comamonas]